MVFLAEHVWQVNVLNRGIGGTSLLCGGQKIPEPLVYRLCLTDKTLSLVPKDHEALHIELSLSNIRSCGSLRNYVFLEVSKANHHHHQQPLLQISLFDVGGSFLINWRW